VELDQLFGGAVALRIFDAHTGKKSPPFRPVKKTRIRKKVKGLGIVHCTGGGDGDAREGGKKRPACFACRGLAGCCHPRSRLAAKLVPFQVKLEWNCGHRRHLHEQDAQARQQQKRNPQSCSGSQVSLPVPLRKERGKRLTARVAPLRQRRKHKAQWPRKWRGVPSNAQRGEGRRGLLSITPDKCLR
jgi:hypothetical protein